MTHPLDRYYTPDHIAAALVNWAVQAPSDHLLDPSFGGCAFFRMGAVALRKKGATRALEQLHGVDIDPEARQYLRPLLWAGAREENFLFADFLSIVPSRLSRHAYEVVVGNPPYVRHHRIRDRRHIDEIGIEAGVRRTAGLWAYFVLHSISFVAHGGTMAMVIPAAILEAEYASAVLSRLEASFSSLHLILMTERVFATAEATTVLLLGRGRGRGTSSARVGVCATSAGLPAFLNSLDSSTREVESAGAYRTELLDGAGFSQVTKFLEDIRGHETSIGEIADVSLGTVTGANQTFLITDAQRREFLGRRAWTVPALPNPKVASGLKVTSDDLAQLARSGAASFLLTIPGVAAIPQALDSHLLAAEDAGIHLRMKCAARDPWYSIVNVGRPDVFLPYMSHDKLRLIENAARATSTNALHHLTWKRGLLASHCRAYVLQSLGSVFQVAAELTGKVYGGGVLKLELKQTKKLPLFSPKAGAIQSVDALSKIADSHLRAGEASIARSLVDAWLGEHFCSAKLLAECRRALAFLRRMRRDVAKRTEMLV